MNPDQNTLFLPMSRQEMRRRGWNQCDIILVSGDAYVDHPSFGIALIGRWLERHGFRVGVIAQPDWRDKSDFMLLGRPKLFFGVSGGNVDSMVANTSSQKHRRKEDDYSPGRKGGLRPDRAVTVYSNRIREAYGQDAVIVLGGIEASLRRLAHYDYWDDAVRRSILFDTRSQILVYGMGEKAVLEIARKLQAGVAAEALDEIPGTAVIRKTPPQGVQRIDLPSFELLNRDPKAFNEAFRKSSAQMEPGAGLTLVQPHGDRFLVVHPPHLPLSREELDQIYELPYTRRWHPGYDRQGGVPALETVRHSITSHRGCCGECSFCALFFHQGRIIQSRSAASILREAARIAAMDDFRGTISDIGGPTANLYGARCKKWETGRYCRDRSCLTPSPCPSLKLDYDGLIRIYREVMRLPKVKHLFIGSGLRYDLLLDRNSDAYLDQLCRHQIGGILKVAPEHSDAQVLDLMNKPRFDRYEAFVERFIAAMKSAGKKSHLVNYLITDHPGTTLEASYRLAGYLRRRGMKPEQVQDFLPCPMTRSTAMYYTGIDPVSRRTVQVNHDPRERRLHRALLQPGLPGHRRLVDEAMNRLNHRITAPEKPIRIGKPIKRK